MCVRERENEKEREQEREREREREGETAGAEDVGEEGRGRVRPIALLPIARPVRGGAARQQDTDR